MASMVCVGVLAMAVYMYKGNAIKLANWVIKQLEITKLYIEVSHSCLLHALSRTSSSNLNPDHASRQPLEISHHWTCVCGWQLLGLWVGVDNKKPRIKSNLLCFNYRMKKMFGYLISFFFHFLFWVFKFSLFTIN